MYHATNNAIKCDHNKSSPYALNIKQKQRENIVKYWNMLENMVKSSKICMKMHFLLLEVWWEKLLERFNVL